VDRKRVQELLEGVRDGSVEVSTAAERLRDLPYEDLGFARLDHHRGLRQGLPEVIYSPGKTPSQVAELVLKSAAQGGPVLATRAAPEQYVAVLERVPRAEYRSVAQLIVVADPEPPEPSPGVAILTGGTVDIPAAEEAAATAELMGSEVDRIFDVGVAGLHRLLDQRERIARANVVIVLAGMDGALASVVAGLVDVPVIGVPLSVGYGASFSGLSPLLNMLTACAPGVAVVNIDNGFGAGYLAALINRSAVATPSHAGAGAAH
jgi:pyridinium-3,5-biscarboxylic acid mononucleotide synthase